MALGKFFRDIQGNNASFYSFMIWLNYFSQLINDIAQLLYVYISYDYSQLFQFIQFSKTLNLIFSTLATQDDAVQFTPTVHTPPAGRVTPTGLDPLAVEDARVVLQPAIQAATTIRGAPGVFSDSIALDFSDSSTGNWAHFSKNPV